MGFGPFILLSLFYVFIGLRVVRRLVREWRVTFDATFTQVDRGLVDEAAFFLLLPLSVALHELGHAVAIWVMGGAVTGFGFFGFAGYVSYQEPFSEAQRIGVALAGPAVNLLLSGGVLGFVLARRAPPRAAINELLVQFAFISGVNAFIFYPAFDFATGLHGDWYQVYFGGAAGLSGVILAGHIAVLAAGFWLVRDPGMRARFGRLTAVPKGYERGVLGGIRPATLPAGDPLLAGQPSPRAAAERVASGWPVPVEVALRRTDEGEIAVLTWHGDGLERTVVAFARTRGGVEIAGRVDPPRVARGVPPSQTAVLAIERLPGFPSPDDLTLSLRVAMELVEGWRVPTPVADAG